MSDRQRKLFKFILIPAIIIISSVLSIIKVVEVGLYLSPDSYIYLDIAKNLYSGGEIVHSFVLTSELEQWEGDGKYIPVTYWAPGFPVYIHSIQLLLRNISVPTAGVIVIAISYILTMAVMVFISIRSYNFQAGLWTILIFLICFPVTYTYSWIWSDGVVIPFMLLSLYLLMANRNSNYKYCLFLAGGLAGMSFAIRYIQGLLLPYSLFIILLTSAMKKGISPRQKIKDVTLHSIEYLLGWILLTIPVLIRNIIVTGRLLDNPRPASNISVIDNLRCAIYSLTGEFLPPNLIPSDIQKTLLLIIFLIYLLIFTIRRKNIEIKKIIFNNFSLLFLTWGLFFFAGITLYSSLYQIDVLGHRLLLPFSITLIFLLSTISEKVIPLPSWGIVIGIIISELIFFRIYPYENTYFYTTHTFYKNNPRLEWVCSHTQPGDWIIGDSTFDISLLCDNRRSFCFVPGSSIDKPPDKDILNTFIKKVHKPYAYIVVRKGVPFEEGFYSQWIENYGEVITELFFHRRYGNIRVIDVDSGKGFLSAKISWDRD